MLPTEANNMDFADWIIDGSSTVFKSTDTITSDVSLTATYSENIASLRASALKEIRDSYEFIKKSVSSSSTLLTYLDPIYERITKGEDSPLLNTLDKDTLISTRDFTLKSFYTLATSDSAQYDIIAKRIMMGIDEIATEEIPSKAAAKIALSSSLISAISLPGANQEYVEKANTELLKIIENAGEEDVDRVAKIVEHVASGALTASAFAIETTFSSLLDHFKDLPQKLKDYEAKKAGSTEDLTLLTNDYYAALAKITTVGDFNAVKDMYDAAIDFYITNKGTVVEKEQYSLYVSCLKDIAIAKVTPISQLATDMKNAVNDYVEQVRAYCQDGETSKISFFNDVCAKRLKAISNLGDKDENLSGIIDSIETNLCQNNFNPYLMDFYRLVMETATNIKSTSSYAILQNYATECFTSLISGINLETSDPNREAKIQCIIELNEDFIRSAAYCDILTLDTGKNLADLRGETIENILKVTEGEFADKGVRETAKAIIISSTALNLAKKYSVNTTFFAGKIANFTSTLNNNFVMFDGAEGSSELLLLYAHALRDNLWKAMDNFNFYLEIKTPEEAPYMENALKYTVGLISTFTGQEPEHCANTVKFYSLFMSQTNNFFKVYVDGSYSQDATYARIKRFINQGLYQLESHFDCTNYDEVLNVWENDFFAKVDVYSDYDDDIKPALNDAVTKANEIAEGEE